jgi:hypothetical protein
VRPGLVTASCSCCTPELCRTQQLQDTSLSKTAPASRRNVWCPRPAVDELAALSNWLAGICSESSVGACDVLTRGQFLMVLWFQQRRSAAATLASY